MLMAPQEQAATEAIRFLTVLLQSAVAAAVVTVGTTEPRLLKVNLVGPVEVMESMGTF